MDKKELGELNFSDKIYFFSKLVEHYTNKEGEFYYKKGLVVDLFLKAVNIVFEELPEKRDLTDKELLDILWETYSPDYIESIIDKDNQEQELGIKTGIGCIIGILEGDNEVFQEEIKELAGE